MNVLLLAMPWQLFHRPSLQLAVLKSYILSQEKDIALSCRHPYLEVVAAIGPKTYRRISASIWAGEALYSGLLFPECQTSSRKLFTQELGESSPALYDITQSILDRHLDSLCADILASPWDLIGFSLCFSQFSASLLLAQRLKQACPDTPIVLGGSSCNEQNAHGMLHSMPDIDFVITGEGEQPLTELIQFLLGKVSLTSKQIHSRQSVPGEVQTKEIPHLDDLPTPDFADYFKEIKQSGLTFIPHLPLEFSRGCWWNRCSFCNLNLQWHSYRFKSAPRMLKEVAALLHRHQVLDFFFADNALPPQASHQFFQQTAKAPPGIRFFAEIRALPAPEAYELYRQGGLTEIQVGIEALSDSLLERMHKGTKVIDNIAAMKFAAAQGIRLSGNIIIEFPESTVEEIQETLDILDLVLPYQPLDVASFFLGLNSPIFCNAKHYGIRHITPHRKNQALFPARLLKQVPMLAQGYSGDRTLQEKNWRPVRKQMQHWQTFHKNRESTQAPLTYRDGGTFLIIRQERPGQEVQHHKLQGLSREIYLQCARPISQKELLQRFNQVTKEQLNHFLHDLRSKYLLYKDHQSCLALAIESH